MARGEPCRGQSNQRLPPCCRAVQCADGLRCRAPVPPPSPGRWYPNGEGDPHSPASALCLNRGVQPSTFGVSLGMPPAEERMQGSAHGGELA